MMWSHMSTHPEYLDNRNQTCRVTTAVKVATIGNSGWTHLTKEGDGIWKGAVDTGDGGHELTLNAMFEEGSNSYTNLLTYQVY